MKVVILVMLAALAASSTQTTPSVLTLRDAIEIVADYEILHPQVPYQTNWYGMTEPDMKQIFIIKNADLAIRRRTAIHELIHVARHNRGYVVTGSPEEEAYAVQQADVLYRALFGGEQ